MTVTNRKATRTVKIASLMTALDELMVVYMDNRAAAEIADEWEGNDSITITDDLERETVVDGYSLLARMVREENGEVYVGLKREVNANA